LEVYLLLEANFSQANLSLYDQTCSYSVTVTDVHASFFFIIVRPALIPASPVIRTLARRWTPTYIPPQTPTYYIRKLCFYKHQFVYMIYINKKLHTKLWSKKLCQNKIINFIYSRYINKTFSQLMHINFFV
jgi:hypothetical protein